VERLIGFRKTSLVDYPGRVAAALFFPGCNLRCPWCHNRELVSGGAKTSGDGFVRLDEAFEVISKRRTVLGGVVFSGGEALLSDDLEDSVSRVKREGLPVKLDTNGTLPERLEQLLRREETKPDYIALDLKIAPSRSAELGTKIDYGRALALSAELISSYGVPHEYRSLALPEGAFGKDDVEALAPFVDESPWFFSAFKPGNCLDARWDDYPPSAAADVRELARAAAALGKNAKER